MAKFLYATFQSTISADEVLEKINIYLSKSGSGGTSSPLPNAKIATSDVDDGLANGVVFYTHDYSIKNDNRKIVRWEKHTEKTKSRDNWRKDMYDPILNILSTLEDRAAAFSAVSMSDMKNGTAYITLWVPIFG